MSGSSIRISRATASTNTWMNVKQVLLELQQVPESTEVALKVSLVGQTCSLYTSICCSKMHRLFQFDVRKREYEF